MIVLPITARATWTPGNHDDPSDTCHDNQSHRNGQKQKFRPLLEPVAVKCSGQKRVKEVFIERTEDALKINPRLRHLMSLLHAHDDRRYKYKNKEEEIKNYDIAELVAFHGTLTLSTLTKTL